MPHPARGYNIIVPVRGQPDVPSRASGRGIRLSEEDGASVPTTVLVPAVETVLTGIVRIVVLTATAATVVAIVSAAAAAATTVAVVSATAATVVSVATASVVCRIRRIHTADKAARERIRPIATATAVVAVSTTASVVVAATASVVPRACIEEIADGVDECVTAAITRI